MHVRKMNRYCSYNIYNILFLRVCYYWCFELWCLVFTLYCCVHKKEMSILKKILFLELFQKTNKMLTRSRFVNVGNKIRTKCVLNHYVDCLTTKTIKFNYSIYKIMCFEILSKSLVNQMGTSRKVFINFLVGYTFNLHKL